MTRDAASNAKTLTGVWSGLFDYAAGESVSFIATLIEAGNSISGSTHELCSEPQCPRKSHDAMLAGSRRGSTVDFIKTYDPQGFGYEVVEYSGTVNAAATEIDGR